MPAHRAKTHPRQRAEHCIACRKTRRGCHLAAAAAMLALSTQGCGGSPGSGAGDDAPPIADSSPLVLRQVNLGVVPRAGRQEVIARLANPTDRSVRWSALGTTCECLSVIVQKEALEPCDDMLVKICLDLRETPEFVGNLAVEVTALGPDGADAFRFDVLGQVVPEGELAFCTDRDDP